MKKLASLSSLLCILCLITSAEEKAQPKPAVISAKTVSFITFSIGEDAKKLKDQTTAFFSKWKRYQIVDDPSQADLIVLIGPMPRQSIVTLWTPYSRVNLRPCRWTRLERNHNSRCLMAARSTGNMLAVR